MSSKTFFAARSTLCLAMIASAATALAGPLGTAITYQGQLSDGGLVANGSYDLRFRLYDSAAGGLQVGPELEYLGEPIADGLFTRELDFGSSIFSGSALWLEIDVRLAGGGAYTTLSPRQPINAAPYALYALSGPGSGAGFWQASGTAITNSNTGFVGVNRTDTVSSAEVFGIQAPVTSGYGGMYIRTDGDAGWPFYGYACGSGFRAWTYLDGSTGDWHLYHSGVAMTVNTNGQVGIGTTTPTSAKLDVAASTGLWGLRVTGTGGNSAIFATLAGTGSAPTIYATNSSTGAGARAVQGLLTGSPPGSGSAGVAGIVSSTISTDTYGVYGKHTGAGYGVYGESLSTTGGAGVFGSGRYAVYGVANTTNGFGGVFAGGGAFGSGPALWSVGDTLVTGGLRIGSAGAFTPASFKLQVENGADASPAGGGAIVVGTETARNIAIDDNEIMARNNFVAATLFLNHNGGNVEIGQASGGTSILRTPILQITGGADFSEMFQVTGSADARPGMVVVIDPQHPGQLVPSSSAYDRKVAGIISGAGGVATGMTMGHQGTIADGDHPVALSGRVYCLVDATEAAVEPGDMLTTSDTRGHAMKAGDDQRAHGAIIGKAMTALSKGQTGLVLVLVNLQ